MLSLALNDALSAAGDGACEPPTAGDDGGTSLEGPAACGDLKITDHASLPTSEAAWLRDDALGGRSVGGSIDISGSAEG